MNLTILIKKAPIVLLVLLCFVISFYYVEANKTIRIRKVKHIAPRHIAVSARSGNGVYARRYAYGRPIPNYSVKRDFGKIRRNFNGRRRRNGRGANRTYASRYRNWTSNGPRGRVDKINQKKRKELYPFLKEPQFGGSKQKRRIRPHRLNAMQRPQPPKKPDFDEEYFFPEEERRAEKYEFDRPRPKNKRRPEREGVKKPDLFSKIPYYDEKPYRTKNREPVSYSSFVQHPSGGDSSDDLYEDSENSFSQPTPKKKKRVKKKKKNKNKDEFRPFVFEDDQVFESYPPYSDDYEVPKKNKKRNKPSYDADEDDFAPNKNSYYSKPSSPNAFRYDSDYRGTQNAQTQFNPTYSQTWSQVVETTARPVQPVQYQTEHGFQPQYSPSQYSNQYNNNVQKTKQVVTNTQTYYSQPDNVYKGSTHNNNYLSNQATSINTQTPNYSYNTYSNSVYSSPASSYSNSVYSNPAPTYSNSVYSNPAPTYSQPVPSSSSILSDVTIQKSVPIYDNTETFYNFNNNAYVNSQSSKYYAPTSQSTKYHDQEQKYGARIPASTSYGSKITDKDSDSEFIKKHQNLYNKGLSGVPIQGDGYAKESAKKDYDIGYGDFQFDENPNS